MEALLLAWFLGVARDDLDLLSGELCASITLELDILHKEGPDIVTEAVRLQMAL